VLPATSGQPSAIGGKMVTELLALIGRREPLAALSHDARC